ncbi:MAG: glycosyltransferase family 2 protein [Desulfonatronovibrionaceae bacterium]
MLVSVVIPVFNRAWCLARAIDSVLAQTIPGFELLIVDDGSTDSSPGIVHKYNDKRIRYFYQQHKGVSAARNLGIRKSRGDLIALLDSDDCWFPDKLACQLEFMHAGNWKISQTEERWIRCGRRVNPRMKHAKPAGWIFEPSLELCLVSPSCSMFTRTLIEDIGLFREDLSACEDYELWLRVALRYPVGLLPQELCVRTGGHSDQLSSRVIGMDLYRIYGLMGILEKGLASREKKLVLGALGRKTDVYVSGCLKRDKPEEAQRVKAMVEKAVQDQGGFFSL